MTSPKDDALKLAIKEAGGKAERLADALEITPQALSQWRRVPAMRVLEVERITGVPRHVLRPDIYPAPEHSGAA